MTQALFFKIILTLLLLVKCGKGRRKRRAQGVHLSMYACSKGMGD